ncbi:GH32 C-terminal domain-containing protein [Agrobacterium rubi]|uniref:beta-fructofuranosidase n=1 Tax=Agrobacterium rubi TaxID=28099 RepID=A0AAE7R483_9HYPH|nr:GH32 C-terminal domain-containing protein [Agrobacterium rubi]NTE85777.1 glycoside hydrolase family 32 protein [Agrobacterium rubi]NTF01709.1 glycoside hydrolase family 32 protein [Agrobacterium rubi]NTF35952.1 glycoside hydrolase family 32 protein [Agrobacterium rubi]OCJ53235.1 beta-fructofuranosidase [Agrobacterium rubi]QTG01051.1 glycoside hydrolase family 32 protein [Agrobacterium rubi]
MNDTALPVEIESAVRTIQTDLPVNATFHVWLKAKKADEPGSVSFSNHNGKFGEVSTTNVDEYNFRIYQVFGGGRVELSYDTVTTAVSVMYWFIASDVLETGITVVHTKPDNAAPDLPDSYHFRPPFGWMNDPNGFGRFEGRPHLFYQHYSHGLRWNTMHWGHAVSSDYLRWRHLPIFLFPSEDLTTRPDKRGGAYSGSTIPLVEGTGIRVFFTEQVQDRLPEQQIQLTATSSDLIMAGQADVILGHRPDGQGLTPDFRDPYVVRGPDGLWKMLLGSQSDGGGVILLYETQDPTAASGWTYVGKLWVETRYKTTAIECPCLLPLDGPANARSTRWVLTYGLMHSEDAATGRKNLTMADVGWFDGKTFVKEFGQELDFGTDNYAFQAFLDGDTIVGIGWLANWADATPEIDFPTAMTLPRRLHFSHGALLTPPIGAAESLRHRILDRTRLAAGERVEFPTGAVELLFELTKPGLPFELELDHPGVKLGVVCDETGLWIRHEDGREGPSPRYIAEGARPFRLRIFLDYGSIEVFADHGRYVGTKRIDSFQPVRAAHLKSIDGAVAHATIWALKQ